MLKLLTWFTGRSNNFLSEKLLHVEDDYFFKSKVNQVIKNKKKRKNNLESLEKKSSRVVCGSRPGVPIPQSPSLINIAFALKRNVQRVKALPVIRRGRSGSRPLRKED